MSVTSVAVPPVERLAVERRYTTSPVLRAPTAAVSPARSSIFSACASSSSRVEHLFVADAAARILVHDLDELRDRVLAVADHVPGRAPRRRDELAVDDQQPVIVALEKGLDDHRTRMLASRR